MTKEQTGLTPQTVREVFEDLQAKARPTARAIQGVEVCRAIVRQGRLDSDQSEKFLTAGLSDFVRRALTEKNGDGVFYAQPIRDTQGIRYLQMPLFDLDQAREWVGQKNREVMADRTSILPTYEFLQRKFDADLPPLVSVGGD